MFRALPQHRGTRLGQGSIADGEQNQATVLETPNAQQFWGW